MCDSWQQGQLSPQTSRAQRQFYSLLLVTDSRRKGLRPCESAGQVPGAPGSCLPGPGPEEWSLSRPLLPREGHILGTPSWIPWGTLSAPGSGPVEAQVGCSSLCPPTAPLRASIQASHSCCSLRAFCCSGGQVAAPQTGLQGPSLAGVQKPPCVPSQSGTRHPTAPFGPQPRAPRLPMASLRSGLRSGICPASVLQPTLAPSCSTWP